MKNIRIWGALLGALLRRILLLLRSLDYGHAFHGRLTLRLYKRNEVIVAFDLL